MMPGYGHALIMGDTNTDLLKTNSNFDYNDCVQWNIKDLNYIINDTCTETSGKLPNGLCAFFVPCAYYYCEQRAFDLT